jgi:hypothetical protein
LSEPAERPQQAELSQRQMPVMLRFVLRRLAGSVGHPLEMLGNEAQQAQRVNGVVDASFYRKYLIFSHIYGWLGN